MIRSTTIKANANTIKVLDRMVMEKKAYRKIIIAKIKKQIEKTSLQKQR